MAASIPYFRELFGSISIYEGLEIAEAVRASYDNTLLPWQSQALEAMSVYSKIVTGSVRGNLLGSGINPTRAVEETPNTTTPALSISTHSLA